MAFEIGNTIIYVIVLIDKQQCYCRYGVWDIEKMYQTDVYQ